MVVTSITPENRAQFLEDNKSNFVLIVFNAEFVGEQDIVDKAVNALSELCNKNNNVVVATADAEANNDLALELSVLSVPVVVFLSPNGTVKKKIDTLETNKLIKIITEELIKHQKLSAVATSVTDTTIPEADGDARKTSYTSQQEYLKYLTTRAPVMVFMKGQPEAPRCGFSKQLVALLAKHEIKYDSFDILEDEDVRQGLKKYSDWPTYPQIYAKGEFIGGLDILKQMDENGELESTLKI